jgi:uncharacterized protein (DUF58 family)
MATTPQTATPAGRELVFDDVFLHKLEQIELLARKMFRGLLRGERTTARRGRGLEFSDFRHYWPGDDFRHIDWNVYSRLDQLFLKLHASEEDVTLHLIVDNSASMAFGEPSKFDQARRLAAALAYIALNNLDRVAVDAFADGLNASLPATKSRRHMARLLDFLGALACAGTTRFGAALRDFATRTRSPGVVFLISDLLGANEAREGIDALRHGGHDLVVIQLLAEAEIEPPLDGALQMVDSETAAEIEVTVDRDLRSRYQLQLERQLHELESFCRRRGVEYLRASTAIGFEDVILRYLRQGTHLR